ncbi:hypothetical protein H2O64_01350 [Kordia sp. YSTF-M3]|uniref:Carboxypeptidase regulatory-like domain-containing protein n=1 Tax=Kordia aestuariivivens TaxID=2759037 RepID=A0ABR7Q409_9FLAO|nr:hypothetical protein [Kordia aestuariivivens]MBC8753296.1 hypothetical protein [Kordia aestuariivivens]
MKHIVHVLLFLFVLNVNAQGKLGPITISYGEEIKEDKEKIVRIAGELNGKIYTLARKGKKKYFLKMFGADKMEILGTQQIEFTEYKGKDLTFEEIIVIGNNLYAFGSLYDRKAKENHLVGFPISADGKLSKNGQILFNTKVTKKRERGAFYFKESPTGDRLLIMHAAFFDKKEEVQYEVKLFDENLQAVMTNLETVPFEDRRDLEFNIADFDVNVYDDIFIVINESYRDRKAKKNIEKFEVHAFKKESGYAKEIINIDFINREVINCELLATNNDVLHLVGFYSSVRKNGKANKKLRGVYAATINAKTNEVTNLKFNKFDYETKVKLIGERRAKKDKDIKPLYRTHSLIEKEDGGLFLLSEYQQIVVGRAQGIGPVAVQPIIYINNEIIVTSLNADGTVAWTNVIPKEQKAAFTVFSLGIFGFASGNNFSVGVGIAIPIAVAGRGPEYLSAIPIYENGQLTVVFNDNKKNIGVTDIEKIKRLGNYNKAIPTAFVFDDKGEITRIDPEEYQDGQLVIRPGVYYRKGANDYIIYASRRSKDKLGRMQIQN